MVCNTAPATSLRQAACVRCSSSCAYACGPGTGTLCGSVACASSQSPTIRSRHLLPLAPPPQGAPRGGRGGRDRDADRQTAEQRRAALDGDSKWSHDRFEGGRRGAGGRGAARDPRRPTTLGTKMCVRGAVAQLRRQPPGLWACV